MKKFLIKSISFAALVTVAIGGVCIAEIVAEIRAYRRELVAPAEASVLVCNDSQSGNGIDSQLHPEIFNFCAHGRALDQAYFTMKDVLNANPDGKFKTVLFDVSPASAMWSLDLPMPKLVFASKYWLVHYLHYHANIRSLDGGLVVVRDNLVGRRLRHFWRALRGRLVFRSSLYGSFTPMDGVDKTDCPDRYWGLLKAKVNSCRGLRQLTPDSPLFAKVLDKVVDCGRAHGVNVVFMSTPWDEELRKACTAEEMDAFTDLMRRYSESRGCEYLDFLRLELEPDCWGDANHLNRKGAKEFSRLLVETLKERKLL